MSDKDIHIMQQRIAQQRLVERSRLFHNTLVVCREGHVVELPADEL